jgi:hypothetical protein
MGAASNFECWLGRRQNKTRRINLALPCPTRAPDVPLACATSKPPANHAGHASVLNATGHQGWPDPASWPATAPGHAAAPSQHAPRKQLAAVWKHRAREQRHTALALTLPQLYCACRHTGHWGMRPGISGGVWSTPCAKEPLNTPCCALWCRPVPHAPPATAPRIPPQHTRVARCARCQRHLLHLLGHARRAGTRPTQGAPRG